MFNQAFTLQVNIPQIIMERIRFFGVHFALLHEMKEVLISDHKNKRKKKKKK